MNKYIMIIALVLFSTNVVKSDEKTHTLKETGTEAKKQLTLLVTMVSEDIKSIPDYQKKSWAKAKKQNAKTWLQIKTLFTKVKNNVTQD